MEIEPTKEPTFVKLKVKEKRPIPVIVIALLVLCACLVLAIILVGKYSAQLQDRVSQIEGDRKSSVIQSEKKQKNLKDSLQNLTRENESLKFKLKKAEENMSTALEERTYLEDVLINKNKMIEKIMDGLEAENEEEVAERFGNQDSIISNLKMQLKDLSQKSQSLYQVIQSELTKIKSSNRRNVSDVIDDVKEKIKRQWNASGIPSTQTSISTMPYPAPDAQTGRILSTNDEHGFVIVNLGRLDGVQVDDQFEIRKEGRLVSNLVVIEVRDVMSACQIQRLEKGESISSNDIAILKK